jgi:murein DD-endopeptidase MepM/ murein hydrolase activator NlpD
VIGPAVAILLPLLLAAPAEAGIVPVVQPEILHPGTPARITLGGCGDGCQANGTFLGREITFLRQGDAQVGFMGADLDTPPGRHPLRLSIRAAGGAERVHSLEIEVRAKRYPVERLEVDPAFVEPPPEVAARIAEEAERLEALWSVSTPLLLHDGVTARPLEGVAGRNFGRRREFNGQSRSPHSGTDLAAPTGTPVGAAAAGRVCLAADLYFSGRTVVLDHGGGVYTLYAHLSRIAVTEGRQVAAGDRVGEVGATGRVTGPHLHWGARVGAARVDPEALLHLLSSPPT